MDNPRIIHAPMNGRRYGVTAPITQYDYGYLLLPEGVELPTTYEIDFSNDEHKGTSLTVYGGAEGAEVPEELIRTGKDVFAFYYKVGEGYGKTDYTWRIPNHCRPSRDGETPTPSQQSSIDQLIVRSNEAVESAEQSASDADASAQSASADADRAEQAKEDASTFAQRSANSAQASADYSESAQASATASAQSASQSAQIKADVEDLVDDAQGYANASAQSASASANSASQAQGFAQSASASAQSASGYASNAQTSANTASNKASEASTSAQTATQKATESTQSASQALTYKTDAESAKTASQTAQWLAESARDSAQGYAEDAQGYAEDAQASAESISASASQIAQNTANILKAFPTDTASGAVASFSDGADNIPLKSLIVNIDPVQDTSSGDPSPENICPISGWTGMNVSATGKNLFKNTLQTTTRNGVTFTVNDDGSVTLTGELTSSTTNVTFGTVTLPAGAYIANGFQYGSRSSTRMIVANDADVSQQYLVHSGLDVPFTLTEQTTMRVYVIIGSFTYTSGITFYPMIRKATETDATFEPYQGRSIPISWQTEAGTVYGGKLDVLSGVLRVDRLGLDGGDLSWAKVDSYNYGNFYVLPTPLASYVSTRPTVISSSYKSESNQTASSTNDCYVWIRSVSPSNRRIYVKDTSKASMTAEEFRTAMTGVQFVYELAEPIEIQLDVHTINSLYGTNNIFADTGDSAVEYRADTTLYISRLTEPDADMIADSNIVSGQYFMVGNTLYKATANIASGASVIVGTNAIRKSLSEALNEINA